MCGCELISIHVIFPQITLMKQCNKYRKRYIELCTQRKLLNSSLACTPLSQSEEAELDRIERTLPVDSLVLYRQLAIKDAIVRNKQIKQDVAKAAAAAKSKSWFGSWGGGGKNETVAVGDVSLDDLQRDLEQAMHTHLGDMGSFTVDFSFLSSTFLTVTASGRSIAHMRMGLSANCTLRGEGMHAVVQMTDLLVTDEFTPSPVIQNLIAVRSSVESSPEQSPFTVTFRNSNDKIHVAVRALPLQITLNKFCIQQILSIVQVSRAQSALSELRQLQDAYTMATAAYRPAGSDTGQEGVSSTSAWYALAAAQLQQQPHGSDDESRSGSDAPDRVRSSAPSIEVVFEADAPKIVIPEDGCSDMGFLLLDTGRLTVTGEMGPAGMAWQVKLCAINAALPRSVDELYTFNGHCNYVIRPFDVGVDVQTIDKSSGDMTVAINVSPSILGELSADKLSRIMHIIDIVPSTFDKLPLESGNHEVTASATAVPDIIPTAAASSLTFIDSREVDPCQRDIVVIATIPAISLQLQYGSDYKERVLLSIDLLSTDITMRPYDMHIAFDLKSLSIQDFTRDESQINLARTPLEGHESLVHISYTKLNHIKSPLYKEFGTEVLVEFNKLFLNSDASTLLHLRPFYEVVLGKRLAKYPPELVVSNVQSQMVAQSAAQAVTTAPNLEYVPSGMHVIVTLRTISLELLQADSEEYSSDTANKVLDSVVCMDISGLATEVTMAELMTATVNVHSLTIVDTRCLSSEYHFKTILGPSSQPQEQDDVESADLERQSSFEIMHVQPASTGGDLLTISYSEDSASESTLKIDVGAVTSFLSLDTILDLVNIATINAMAVVQLTAKVDSGTSTTSPSPVVQAAEVKSSDHGKAMSTHISLQGARVILLEDPTEQNSRAICLRLGLGLHYHTITNVSEDHVTVDSALHCAITDVEVYVILDMQRNRPHQIMDPMTVLLNYKTSSERDIVLTTHLSVGVDGLHTRFSLADIMLVQTILLRRTMVDSSPTQDASTTEAVSTTDGKSAVEHLTQYQVKLNVGSICAIVINDFEGKSVPLVRLGIDDTIFEVDGFLRDMQGGGSMVLKMDAYNTIVTEWEPLLESWHPMMTVSSDSTDLNLKITSSESLQISITSSFLSCISQTLSIWDLMNEHRGEERRAVPSLTFSNHLGVPIEIVSSATGESIFYLDNDYEGAIFLNHRSTGDVIADVSNRVSEVVARLPTSVDIIFHSPEMTDRRPLAAIPLASVSCRKYAIETRAESGMNQTACEPVIETIYQYKRYMPIKGWGDPCLLGDPPAWSNAAGTKELSKSSVALPSEAWEWVGDWMVDTSGRKHGHVDKDGWEYAVNFTDFTATSKRRGVAQAMDYARRRKWIRTRALRSQWNSASSQSMALFWEVLLLDDGSKIINLRSCLQIHNKLPYDVMLQLTSRRWQSPVELGPLLPDAVLSVPLLFADSDNVRFRGVNVPTDWTPPLPCEVRPLDFETQAEVACTEEINSRMLHLRPVTKQVHKALQITLSPHITITNTVPSRMGYRFYISGAVKRDPRQRVLTEEGSLEAGEKCCLSHVKVTHITHVALNVGDFGWSEATEPIFHKNSNTSRVNIPFFGSDGKVVLTLQLRINQFSNRPYEIIVYSKDALINYSGLDVSVDSLVRKGRSDRVLRSSGGIYDPSLAGSVGAAQMTPVQGGVQSPAVGIDEFKTRSRRRYNITSATVGDAVHTDRSHRFTFLPPMVRGQTFISTPCNDRDLRLDGSNMISFITAEASLVFVLFDKRVCSLPAWVKVRVHVSAHSCYFLLKFANRPRATAPPSCMPLPAGCTMASW